MIYEITENDIDIIDNFFRSIGFNVEILKDYDKIYVLVSGGLDSTLLAIYISFIFPGKTYFVNSKNPYENSKTLDYYKKLDNFIEINPHKDLKYKEIIIDAFKSIPKAYEKVLEDTYHKNVFGCCWFIKHKAFLNDPLFKKKNTVVISGIKRGDGKQRRIFLTQLSQGREPKNQSNGQPTFFHRHHKGQLYCYPYRDYFKKELPDNMIDILKKKFPYIKHSGCYLCPVLVLFDLTEEGRRYKDSVKYARDLGVYPFKEEEKTMF